MIKNKNSIVLFLSAFLFILSFSFSFAYEPIPTHRDLTQKIIEIYNRYYSPKISQEQIQLMLDGSVKEDAPPRWINHFYDPIYKIGWTGEKEGDVPQDTVKKLSKIILSIKEAVSSIDWLHNVDLQGRYGFYEGNQTYEKALRAYAYPTDLSKGLISESPYSDTIEDSYIALGHILHLLEDLGVPAHTRNDTHADVKGSNDFGDPYEKWAAEPGNDNLSQLNNLNPQKEGIACDKIDDCFINLAKYINENFYSKDTIDDPKYKILEPTKKEVINNKTIYYSKDSLGNIFSLVIDKSENQNNRILTIDDPQIHQSYWNLLSKQIVLAGVQALRIFYQNDVPTAMENAQYPDHAIGFKECNISVICKDLIISPYGEFIRFKDLAVSFLNNTIGNASSLFAEVGSTIADTLSSAKNLIKDVFNYDSGLKQVGQINLDNAENQNQPSQKEAQTGETQSNKKSSDQNIQSLKKETTLSKNPDKPKNKQQPEEKKIQEISKTDSDKITAEPKDKNPDNPQSKPQGNKIFSFCPFGASQASSHNSVIINEIAWMGSTKSSADEWIELKNISSQEIDLAGWQIINKNSGIKINLGLINKTKIGAGKFVLLERTDDNSVPDVLADLIYTGGLLNTNEEIKLFDGRCSLIDEVSANPDWPAGDNESKKTMERDLSGFGWHTSAVAAGTPKQNNSQPTTNNLQPSSGGGGSGVSSANNSQQTTNNAQQQTPSKILITEIQITGGTGKTDNDFIELYNPNSTQVNLNGYRLVKRTKTGTTDTGIKSWTNDVYIPANGYYLWANSNYTDISATPDVTTVATISDDNGIAIRFGSEDSGTIIDSVGWGEATNSFIEGAAFPNNPNVNQSIQRKFQNSTFVDTDNNANDFEIQTCPSPKAQSRICQTASSQTPNYILISEIQVKGDSADDEFIELYNPTENIFSLSDYSIQYLSGAATSTENIKKKNFESNTQISAKGFYLIANSNATSSLKDKADMIYSGFSLSGNSSGATIFLVSTTTPILNINDSTIIDGISYGSPILSVNTNVSTVPDSNKSLERKALNNNICVSAQDENEFLGNGCDTNSDSDFEIRAVSNPQNSQSLPEPRQKPETVKNFNINYSSSTIELIFNWDASAASTSVANLIYKIADISSSTLFLQDIETTSTVSRIPIYEVGRDYAFSIRAFDSDGLGSETATSSVSIPSFIKNVSFYKKPDSFFLDQFIFVDNEKSLRKYLIDFSFDQYPFLPGSGYKVAVFYLNSEPTTTLEITSDRGFPFLNGDENQYLKIGYRSCVNCPGFYGSLLLADTPAECNISGGLPNLSLLYNPNNFYNLFEDNNIVLPAYNPKELAPSDYFTVAFYRAESLNEAKLIAIDKNKYYFKNDAPSHYAPSSPTNFSVENYDADSQKLTLGWDYPNDPDSIDINQIFHEISYSTSTNFSFWIPLYLVSTNIDTSRTPYRTKAIISVAPQSSFAIRARDDFNNASLPKIISFDYSSSSLIVSDNQMPAFRKIILDQQLDSSGVAKTFGGDFDQQFIPNSSGYLTEVELKGKHSDYANGVYGVSFRIKIKKDQEIIDASDNWYPFGAGEALPDSLIFRFGKTPFLESQNTYQIMIERLPWPDGGDGAIDFFGAPDAKLYYKINGLTP